MDILNLPFLPLNFDKSYNESPLAFVFVFIHIHSSYISSFMSLNYVAVSCWSKGKISGLHFLHGIQKKESGENNKKEEV